VQAGEFRVRWPRTVSRGLFGRRMGKVEHADGKQVWFRLSTEDWSYRSACLCQSDAIGRVRLDSGRYALAIPGQWDD
jgi:hypothetical protein